MFYKCMFIILGLSALSCQQNIRQEIWNLTAKKSYTINCIDAMDPTTNKHYPVKTSQLDIVLDNELEGTNHGYSCLKYDTSFINEVIDSNSKYFEQLALKDTYSFLRMGKVLTTKYFLSGAYSIGRDTIILHAFELIDKCNNASPIDTVIILRDKKNYVAIDSQYISSDELLVKLKCDSLNGLIGIEPHTLPHDTFYIKLKTNDSLILRKTLKFKEYVWIDFIFTKQIK
jgi:hypothetical protein